MIKNIKTNGKPTTIEIKVQSQHKIEIGLIVSDAEQKKTQYTKRVGLVDGVVSFFVRMPQSPRVARVKIFNKREGFSKQDKSFKVLSIRQIPLKTIDLPMSNSTKAFVLFAQEFCQKAGVLSADKNGDSYKSNNGKFHIQYYDVIRSKIS